MLEATPIVTELVVSVIGGVLTALIIGLFSRGGARNAAPAPVRDRRPRRDNPILAFIRLMLAVAGGIAFALIGGRMLIQAGWLPQGLPTRLGLLVAGIAAIWIFLGMFRRR
ncbi:MAG: hypothetical protein ACFCUN_08895 [Hyphomicrobiaceae bacterium]